MTNDTVSAKLNAVLDPLNSLREEVLTACLLAERNTLPHAFIQTIRAAINRLDAAHDELLEIATLLDPHLAKPQL